MQTDAIRLMSDNCPDHRENTIPAVGFSGSCTLHMDFFHKVFPASVSFHIYDNRTSFKPFFVITFIFLALLQNALSLLLF